MAEGPTFIGIGQMKAATGWLYDQLRSHPDVWVPPVKELHYFDVGIKYRAVEDILHDVMCEDRSLMLRDASVSAEHWTQVDRDTLNRDLEFFRQVLFTVDGRRARKRAPEVRTPDFEFKKRHIEWYRGLFPSDHYRATGEITPAYGTLSRARIERIARGLRDTRFILIVRAPVERARSHLNHYIDQQRISPDAATDPALAATVLDEHPQIAEKSDAAGIARRWSEVVGDRLLVVPFTTVRSEPIAGRATICDFIGVDPAGFEIEPQVNRKASASHVVSDEVMALLESRLATETEAFHAWLAANVSG